MTRFFFTFLITVSVLLSISGCSDRSYNPELEHISSIVKSYPDSALSLIRSFDAEKLTSRKDKAYYAMVYTRAKHNCNCLTYGDSLMKVAEHWYMRHGTSNEKAMLLYCIGNSLTVKDSFPLASEYYSKAEIYAMESGDNYTIAAINCALGYSFRFQMDYDEAIEHFSKATSILENIGEKQQALIPKYQKAALLGQLEEYGQVIEMCRETAATAAEVNDTAMILRFNSLMAIATASYSPSPEAADEAIRRMKDTWKRYNNDSIPVSQYNVLGLLYYYQGNMQEARRLMLKALEHLPPMATRLGCYYTLSMIAENEGKYREALKYERHVTALQDTLFRETKDSMVQVAEKKYRNEHIQESYKMLALKHKYQMFMFFAAAVVLITLTVSVVIFYRKRLKDSRRKIDEAISYIDTVSSGYAELQNRYKVLQEDNQNLNETSSKMLSMLSTRMESIQQLLELASLYESRPAVFYSKFKDLIKVSQFNNTELEQEIISTTNLSYHNILDDLKAMHPDLSLHELCYCGLICLGFSQQSIRVLYDHTNINSIYSLRARIRAKLGISNSNKNLDTYFKELIREKYQ